ncbi:hypothetical protein [Spirillospora sp. NPDC048819]|uniref:hypothetical protein n=1 Tax=Spirillospora sp. NPDC048819 TaxID=3155268 RepID=UPI0033CE1F55
MLLTSPKPDTWAALIPLAVGTVTWQSTVLVVGLLTAWSAMDVLAEWQLRRTLVALARTAPAGRIVIHQDTSRGRAFRVVWGVGSDQRRWHSRT